MESQHEPAGTNQMPEPSATTGPRRLGPTTFNMKSPVLATILSAMPGLGQAYLGYYRQGFINILVVASLIAALNRGVGSAEPFCGLFLAFFWLFNLVDAARKATHYNQALAGAAEPVENLPKQRKSDALIAGAAMILFGLLLLANTRFGVSLDWLGDWWPALLVLTGAYLVATYVVEQRKEGHGA